ncbi:MAG: hypothetical protein ACJ735_12535 [Actinomycetes bacterium]
MSSARPSKVAAVAMSAGVLFGLIGCAGSPHPKAPVVTTPPTASASPTPLRTAGFAFGFYSAGLRLVDCYGTCRPGTKEYAEQQANRQRMADLQAKHVTFVTNNESLVKVYRHYPDAVLTYLNELHAHHIRVSYSAASGAGMWFTHGVFDPTAARTAFARTDLNHDGVSDLDGRLDLLYQGHEVLEWATHAQRVQIYRVAKKWFPHTPVAFYYAGMYRPFDPAWANRSHAGGPGGVWRDYAYGPGEADVVLVNVRRNATPDTLDNVDEGGGGFNAAAFAAAARKTVDVVHRSTPSVPIFVSTNIASDTAMASNPAAMWSATDLTSWYHALAAIPGVAGVQLRSYGRFTYDLANPRYSGQQATWSSLGALAARHPTKGSL